MRDSLRSLLQNLALLAVSTIVALLLCEVGVRLLFPLPGGPKSFSDDTALPKDSPALRHLAAVPLGTGVDAGWFRDAPTPLPRDMSQIDPADIARMKEYIRLGHYGPQSFYIWNNNYVRTEACAPDDKLFKDVTPAFRAFHGSGDDDVPHFRFPPDRLLPTGLRTNRYGFRGPDFPPQRERGVLRIAFVGSSGTEGNHGNALAYPDFVGFWLQKWLAANGYPHRVQIINAGREGIGTTDVQAILEQEVLPLRPDLVVFYDGANQLNISDDLLKSVTPIRGAQHREPTAPRTLPAWLTSHSGLALLVDNYLGRARENARLNQPKPDYTLTFPPQVSELQLDPANPHLPLDLPRFLHDVGVMVTDARATGTPIAMATLPWLDGSEISKPGDARYAQILNQLNTTFWPLRSPDLRRLIDFQNRTLRSFAAEQKVPLLDIAALYPRDPDLFMDLYHHNLEGDRLLGWIMLQSLVPVVQDVLKRSGDTIGVLQGNPPHPADLSSFVIHPRCGPSEDMLREARTVPMAFTPAGAAASVTAHGNAWLVHTPPQAWSYAGVLDLKTKCLSGEGWVIIDVHVAHGSVGIGVLKAKQTDFVARQVVSSEHGDQTLMLHVPAFQESGLVVVETAADPVAADVEMRSVRLASADGHAPPICPIVGQLTEPYAISGAPALPADATVLGGAGNLGDIATAGADSKIEATENGVDVTPPAQQWAYGAAIPLHLSGQAGPVWIRVQAEVRQGEMDVGVLDRATNKFVSRASSKASPEPVVFVLPLPKPGDDTLILQNAAPTPRASTLRLHSLEVLTSGGHAP